MHRKAASPADVTLKILKSQSVTDLERMIHDLALMKARSLDVWLSRDIGGQFFKDARIVALFAFAASKEMQIRVIDWHSLLDDTELAERFGRTLEGIASLEYADKIVSAQKVGIDHRIRTLRQQVIEKNGIKSPESTAGKSLTFCAFDPEAPTPLEFASMNGKADFIKRFSYYRRECFEKGVGEGFSERLPATIDHQLSSFAYELWENTLQHGRLDETGRELKGMRYLRVQKYIDYNRAAFLKKAEGFTELEQYLNKHVPESGTFKFYEISIADHGLGIVARLLATRPEMANILPMDSPEDCINMIMDRALSSKLSQAGAGHGLERALAAVRYLQGFVSLRSGSAWLYYASEVQTPVGQRPKLTSVRFTEPLASIGTQLNLIFPLGSSS
jgi:hypothetical protein